jgi:hypothetical protein
LRICEILSFKQNWVLKSQIRKLPSFLKIRKFGFAELNCRPPTCGGQASVECTCCCVVQRFMPYLTQLLLRGYYPAETTCTKVKTFTAQRGSSHHLPLDNAVVFFCYPRGRLPVKWVTSTESMGLQEQQPGPAMRDTVMKVGHLQGASGIDARFLKLSPASAVSAIMTKFSQYTPHSTCYLVQVSICWKD